MGAKARLREFHQPIARHLQRGPKRTCQRRARDVRARRRIARGTGRAAPSSRRTCPDRACNRSRASLIDHTTRRGTTCTRLIVRLRCSGVGLEQIVDRRRELAHPGWCARLGHTAPKHVAAEALARHQRSPRHRAWPRAFVGGKPTAPPLPRRWAGRRRRFPGQQQATTEVGEPGGHHQVVGGEFEP